MGFRPHVEIHRLAVLDHRLRADRLALLAGEGVVGHRSQPDIGIEADLMAGMAAQHWAAPRLRYVSDHQTGPTVLLARIRGQPLEQSNELGVAPVAVARQSHHLPGRPVDRKCRGAGEAASGIGAEGARRHIGRRLLGAEQFFGRDLVDRLIGDRGKRR